MVRLVAFGCGYVASELAREVIAAGGAAIGTVRTRARAEEIAQLGIAPVVWPGEILAPEPDMTWLVSTPPDDEGCPVWRSFLHSSVNAGWIGYLSTTGVYGDLAGGWAFEETPAAPMSREAGNRAKAEAQWRSAGAHVFRLPGIYGPGRSALERVDEPGARRIVKPGQVFSRAHRDDIARALLASIARPHPGRSYNICDDEPAPADEVLAYAASLLGVDPPPAVAFENAGLSAMARRFYAECKRVSNARAKAELGWTPLYPTYREGLAQCLAARATVPA
jgi:nucleoside-diphosphate-sugar epimerase